MSGLRCCILAGVMAVAANAQKPDAAEPSRALAALRDYALSYTGKMPDFTCTQITQRTYYPNIDLRERPQHDAIEEQITYASHKESYKVIKVNGEASNKRHDEVGGILSSGEFGSLLSNTLAPEADGDFRWDRTMTRNSRRIYVFAFRVPEMKGYGLVDGGRTSLVPYKGRIYADADSGAVERIEMECEIPRRSAYRRLEIALDYKLAEVGGREFLLPSHHHMHSIRLTLPPGGGPNTLPWVSETINEADYKNYRRFDTGTAITFGEAVNPGR